MSFASGNLHITMTGAETYLSFNQYLVVAAKKYLIAKS